MGRSWAIRPTFPYTTPGPDIRPIWLIYRRLIKYLFKRFLTHTAVLLLLLSISHASAWGLNLAWDCYQDPEMNSGWYYQICWWSSFKNPATDLPNGCLTIDNEMSCQQLFEKSTFPSLVAGNSYKLAIKICSDEMYPAGHEKEGEPVCSDNSNIVNFTVPETIVGPFRLYTIDEIPPGDSP